MGVKAPIFRCMLLNCKGEEPIHLYSPKDIEHHLNTKHASLFKQNVAEHDKVQVFRKIYNLFDNDKCKNQVDNYNHISTIPPTRINNNKSIGCKRRHEETNDDNKINEYQRKRYRTNDRL